MTQRYPGGASLPEACTEAGGEKMHSLNAEPMPGPHHTHRPFCALGQSLERLVSIFHFMDGETEAYNGHRLSKFSWPVNGRPRTRSSILGCHTVLGLMLALEAGGSKYNP